VLTAAQKNQAWPVLVVYGIPGRDCGLHSQGGARDREAYLAWVADIGTTIGRRNAIVIVEPDAVPLSVEGCLQHVRPLLAQAVAELRERAPNARLYLDAGNATWIDDLGALRRALVDAGVGQADGVAVNVANVVSTERSIEFAQRLSDGLPVHRFVVDTSRSGADVPEQANNWCNNPHARVGEPPTTDVSEPGLDALLWVKTPGDSDGDCGRGEPPAGQWWQDYAEVLLGP
jgi:endoglucanase